MSLSGNSRPKQKLYLVGGLEHLKKIHILGIIIPTSYGWSPFSAWKSQISTRKLGRRSRADLGASWLPEVPIGARRAAVFGDRRASCEESFDDKFYMKTMIIEYDNHDNYIYNYSQMIPGCYHSTLFANMIQIDYEIISMKTMVNDGRSPWDREGERYEILDPLTEIGDICQILRGCCWPEIARQFLNIGAGTTASKTLLQRCLLVVVRTSLLGKLMLIGLQSCPYK